jgi:hypothetical protein
MANGKTAQTTGGEHIIAIYGHIVTGVKQGHVEFAKDIC